MNDMFYKIEYCLKYKSSIVYYGMLGRVNNL